MNVVELCGLTRSAGGLFYAVSALCRALGHIGVDVVVYGKDEPFVDEDRTAWGDISTLTYKAFGPLQSSFQLRSMLRARRPDLIHHHGIWMDDQWAALQWQIKTGHPVVISPHGMLDPWAVRNSAWKKKLAGRLFANESFSRATCIHALCRSEAESIRAYGLTNPIALIPNGVELPEISLPNSKPKTSNQKKLLFLGRIHPKKGLAELVEAWSQRHGAWRKEWKLVIAGWDDGGHESGLKSQAVKLGIEDSIEFIGSKYGAEKDRLLRSVDAFILPSFSEGLPMSVLEAWSYRLPVVMTDFCNLPEGFDAAAAIRIEPSSESVLQGLEKLAAMAEDELEAMGSNGRKLVEENFTWPGIAESMRKVYEWCLTGVNPPACMEFIDG